MKKKLTPAIPALIAILAYLFNRGWPTVSPDIAKALFWICLTATMIAALIVFWDNITPLIPVQISRKKPLQKIPEILNKMNKRLTVLVEKQTKESPIKPEIIGDDYVEIFANESMLTELKELENTSDPKIAYEIVRKWFDNFVQEINKNTDLQDFLSSFLIRLNGLMNLKGIGIAKITDSDAEYIKLTQQLEYLRPKMTKELHTAVSDYLEHLYGWESLYIFLSSLSSVFADNIVPAKMRAEYGAFKQRMETNMNELLGEVTSIVQNLSSKNSGTGEKGG